MATIQSINPIYLSGNLPDFSVQSAADQATVVVRLNGSVILNEVYNPANGEFVIKLKYLLCSLLYAVVPPADEDMILQLESLGIIQIVITDGGAAVNETFLVLKGGVDSDPDVNVFLTTNFLTWQPQQKKIQYSDPEFLTYCSLQACNVKLKAYLSDNTNQTITFATLAANHAYTLNLAYARLVGKFTAQPVYFEVWTEDMTGDRLSYIQRYIYIEPATIYNDVFVFENTLGGIDTVHFLGEIQESNDFTIGSALFDETTLEYDIDISIVFNKKTGYVEKESDRYWWLEFFKSINRYHISEGALKRIFVTKPKLDSIPGAPNGYEFSFAYAFQTKYISLPRLDTLPSSVDITDPSGQLFFLAPRLAQFPWANAVDNPLFLVQLPNSDTWSVMSLSQIKDGGIDVGVNNLTNYYNKTDSDLRYKPIGYSPDLSAYSTKTQADLLYKPFGYSPDLSGYLTSSALSGWAGNLYISSLGTITAGTWHGSKIEDSYLASTFLKAESDTLDSVLGRGNDTARSVVLKNGTKTFTLSVDASGNLVLTSNTMNTAVTTNGDLIAFASANPVVSWWDALGGYVDGVTMQWIGGKLVSVATGSIDVNVNTLTYYYLKSEINNFFNGVTAITGYNKSSWDNAATDRHSHSNKTFLDSLMAFAGTGSAATLARSDHNHDLLYKPIGYSPDLSAYVTSTGLSTWAGNLYITSLGTIVTGVWHGSKIDDAYLTSTFLKVESDTLDSVLGRGNDTSRSVVLKNGTKTFTLSVDSSGNLVLTSNTGSTAVTTNGDIVAFAGSNPVVDWWDALGGYVDGTTVKWIGGKLVSVASGSGAIDVNVNNLTYYYLKSEVNNFFSGVTSITGYNKGNWDNAATDRHSHSNKSYLDAISGTVWTSSNFTDNHSHWDTAYGWGNHALAGYVTGTPWTTANTTGNASTASTAYSVAWTNVSSRPLNLSDFNNNLGNYGSWITGINSTMVTNALGYTPWYSGNHPTTTTDYGLPSYPTLSSLGAAPAVSGGYLPLSGGTMSNTSLVGNLNAEKWHGQPFNGTAFTGTPPFIMALQDDWVTWAPISAATTKSFLGLGSNAYNSTAYLPLSAGSSYPLTGTLYGTVANFSGVLNVSSHANTSYIQFVDINYSTSRGWRLGEDFNVFGDFTLQRSTTTGGSTYADVLSFTNSGAATFSSTVAATTAIFSNLTANYIPKHTAGGLVNSGISDNGSHVKLSSYSNYYVDITGGDQINVVNGSGTPLGMYLNYNGGNVNINTGNNGNTIIGSTTASTSSTTGALVVAGGIGVGGGINVGGSSGFQSNSDPDVTVLSAYQANGTTRKWQIDKVSGGFKLYMDSVATYTFVIASDGNATFSGSVTASGDVIAFSDLKLKRNIRPLQNSLAIACALNGVTFNWNGMDGHETVKTHNGYIAQEVQYLIPNVVIEQSNGLLGIAYQKIIPVLSSAIKELNNNTNFRFINVETEVQKLRREVATLKQEVQNLRSRLN